MVFATLIQFHFLPSNPNEIKTKHYAKNEVISLPYKINKNQNELK